MAKSPDDPLARYKDFKLAEAYEVIRTVEVVKGDQHYRLEVTQSVSNQNSPYDVRCYRWAEERGWLPVHIGACSEKTAESSLQTAMSWVSDI